MTHMFRTNILQIYHLFFLFFLSSFSLHHTDQTHTLHGY